ATHPDRQESRPDRSLHRRMKSRISTRGPPLTPGRKLGLDHLSRDNFAPIELVQSASQLGDLFLGEVRIRGGAMFTDAQGDGVLDKFILSATKLTGDAFEFGVQFVGDVDLGHGSAPFGQYNAALSHPIRAWMGYPRQFSCRESADRSILFFSPRAPYSSAEKSIPSLHVSRRCSRWMKPRQSPPYLYRLPQQQPTADCQTALPARSHI